MLGSRVRFPVHPYVFNVNICSFLLSYYNCINLIFRPFSLWKKKKFLLLKSIYIRYNIQKSSDGDMISFHQVSAIVLGLCTFQEIFVNYVGWVWTNQKTNFNQWSIECVFKVTGRGRVGADGLVNYYFFSSFFLSLTIKYNVFFPMCIRLCFC